MAFSPEYIACCKRILELRRNLLPRPFSATGTYAPQDYDRTRAYIALVHAEIEHYIEQRAQAVAIESVNRWHKKRTSGDVVFALYAMCYTGWAAIGGTPETLPPVTNQNCVEARLGSALKQFCQVVANNHGIKEENLKSLLVPLSIRLQPDLDQLWIANMSSFAGNRGRIAHQSGTTYAQPDPRDTWSTTWNQLLPGLRTLDRVFTSLS